MPTIVFASSKGGVGKTTAAVILASELALKGAEVTIIDADRNKPVSDWESLQGCPANISVVAHTTEETIIEEIDSAAERTPFVIVDVEGTASRMIPYAISRADLVIIPTQGSRLDAKEAAKVRKLIREQECETGKKIPYAILFTRTSAVILPRTLKSIQAEFVKHGVLSFETHIHDREAYRAIFSFGGTIEGLDPRKVTGIGTAVINARAFASEVVAMLRDLAARSQQKAEVA